MRPRNKFDKEIVILNNKVKPVNPKAIDWALKKIFRHPAFRSKTEWPCVAVVVNHFNLNQRESNQLVLIVIL